MISHTLTLLPHEDGKRWLAEITGDDETFIFQRVFQPEYEEGTYKIYDGWYQIHGLYPGITPFVKEYVTVQEGQMTRRISYQEMRRSLPEIIAYEPVRRERIEQQIKEVFDEIYAAVPYEAVQEGIISQLEAMSLVESSAELTQGLSQLLKQKEMIIQRYQRAHDQGYFRF